MAEPTSEQLRLLRHMLGINNDKRDAKPYRNYYCANEGDPKLAEMAEAGLVELIARPSSWLPYNTYHATERGIALAIESQKQMRCSPGRQRWREYLSARDTGTDLTFIEWLRWRKEQSHA